MKGKIIFTAIILLLSNTTTSIANSRIVLDNFMFKQSVDRTPVFYNTRLDELLKYYDDLKRSGSWTPDGTRLDVNTRRHGVQNTSGLQRFELDKSKIDPKFLQKNHGQTRGTAFYRSDIYQKALNEPLASQWKVLGDSSYVLTADDWINNLPATANPRVPEFIRDVYRATAEQAAMGNHVSPDFLIALSMLESGWGNGRLARDRNSWFSVAAYNSNPDNARGYATPYDATVDVIKLLTKNYAEGGKYYIEGLGPTILGINTYYCVFEEAGTGLYFTSPTWSTKIVSVLDSAARRAGKTFPRP